jgi:hypothetical protein
MGPIHSQAKSVMAVMASPRTAVHLVTLLEEMPVQETIDGVGHLHEEGLPVGAVIVNADRPPQLTARQRDAALTGELDRAAIAAAVHTADVITSRDPHSATDVADALLEEARDHAERVAVAEQERATLTQLDLPQLSLPHMPTGIDLGALYEMAAHLRAAGLGAPVRP